MLTLQPLDEARPSIISLFLENPLKCLLVCFSNSFMAVFQLPEVQISEQTRRKYIHIASRDVLRHP